MEKLKVIVRIAGAQQSILWKTIFKRYPKEEWGTFARFGWCKLGSTLIITLQHVDTPQEADIDEENWMTEIQSQYIRRIVVSADQHAFSVGFIHSHPEGYETHPSIPDIDMEDYLRNLLYGYTKDRPFISLIFAQNDGLTCGSGRVYFEGQWHDVSKFFVDQTNISLYNYGENVVPSVEKLARVERLSSVYSIEAATALADAKVAVIGNSGTGSPAIEILARAGVKNFILVDPDIFSPSNLERIHGSGEDDIGKETPKVLIAKRHILSINADAKVICFIGKVPQEQILEELFSCNIVLGCTDLQSSRVALGDIATRFLIPVIDVGVSMEGGDGIITGQIIQLNRLFVGDPCVYCRGMINAQVVSQELMTEENAEKAKEEAEKAKAENRIPNAYWIDIPQLNTVGYLTTMAGSMLAGYTIGFLTGRFDMVHNRIELAFIRKGLNIVQRDELSKDQCVCVRCQGSAVQDPMAKLGSVPSHWPEPRKID